MGVMKVLGASGHDTYTWEPGTASEDEVKARFDDIVGRFRGPAFAVTKDNPHAAQQIHTFDPDAAEILVTIPIAGGSA